MPPEVERSVEILQRTPAVLRAWLDGLSDFWTHRNYGPATFSPFDVVGHLIHADRTNWLPRLRHLLAHGETQPFAPFDRYAMYEASQGQSLADLLHTFAALRARSLADLRSLHLTPESLTRRGRHPDLGPVTLGHLIAARAVHDLNHLSQIAKAMAYQHREAVGPWREYLSILPGS